jgi:hypothetical protein
MNTTILNPAQVVALSPTRYSYELPAPPCGREGRM